MIWLPSRPMSSARRADSTAEVISASYITWRASQGGVGGYWHPSGWQEALDQDSPVDTDANRLVPPHRSFDHLAKLAITLVTFANIARIDTVLRQCLCTIRKIRQEPMPVVMKIPDQRNAFPIRSSCSRIYGTAAAASGVLTVIRTNSDPA